MDEIFFDSADKMRNKTIAAILEAKDNVEHSLSKEDAAYLRKVILDEMNFYHNFMMDLLEASADDSIVVNQKYLSMIEQIYAAVANE